MDTMGLMDILCSYVLASSYTLRVILVLAQEGEGHFLLLHPSLYGVPIPKDVTIKTQC